MDGPSLKIWIYSRKSTVRFKSVAVLYHCKIANFPTLNLYISASIALLYAQKYDGLENMEIPGHALEITLGTSTART